MTTLVYIENVLGSGQIVKLKEDFGDYSVTRDLRPGEHARLVVSPFKSVWVEEVQLRSGVVAPERAEFAAPRLLGRRLGAAPTRPAP